MNTIKLTLYSLAIMLGAGKLNAMQPATFTLAELNERELACQAMLNRILWAPAGTMEQHFQEIAQFRALNPVRPRIPVYRHELAQMNNDGRATAIAYLTHSAMHNVPAASQTTQETPVASQPDLPSPIFHTIKPNLAIQKLQSEKKADAANEGQFGVFQWKTPSQKIARNILSAQTTASPLNVLPQKEASTPEERAIPISRTTSSELGARELAKLEHKSPATSIAISASIERGANELAQLSHKSPTTISASSSDESFSSPAQSSPLERHTRVQPARGKRSVHTLADVQEAKKRELQRKLQRREQDLSELEARVTAAAVKAAQEAVNEATQKAKK